MNGIKLTKEQLLASAKLFNTKEDWRKYRKLDYQRAVQQKILSWIYEQCGWTMKPFTRWTYEKCKDLASQFKYAQDWKERHFNSYKAAQEHGWLSEIRKELNFKPRWSSRREGNCNV